MEPLPPAIQFLNQRFLAEGCMSAEQAQELWDASEFDKGSAQNLKAALGLSNRQLAAAGLEIRGVIVDDSAYYAMVNKQADDIAKAGFNATFTTTEINYIRLIIGTLTDETECTKANLINLKNSLKEKDGSLTMDQAVAILDRLIHDQWIWPTIENSRGKKKRRHSMQTRFSLAPRAFMELSYMLVDQFGMQNTELPQQIYFT